MESFHEKIANPFNFVDYQADILPSITAKFHLNEKNQIINNQELNNNNLNDELSTLLL